MNPPADESRLQRVREAMRGFPAGTAAAAEEFLTAKSASALDAMTLGVLAFYLPSKPGAAAKPDLAALPGTTRLVEDLAFDSLSMVEMNFLLEDVIGMKIPDDDLRALRTIDDLKALLRRHAGVA
jgi:acyl carrier protein